MPSGFFGKILPLFAAAAVSAAVFAEPLTVEAVVGPEYAAELKKSGTVSVIHDEDDTGLSLVPNCAYSDMVKNGRVEKKEKGVPFTAEFLYLIPKEDLLKNSASGRSELTIDDISVVFRSISRMTGMKYFSGTRKKEDVLYKTAYMTAGPESEDPIPDQNTGNADGQVSYCYQHDHTYGDCRYRLEYYQSGNVLYATFLNVIPMSYMGIKAVPDGNLKISVIAIDCGENLVLYLSTDTNAKDIKLVNVRKQIQESMLSRMDAVYRWFLVQF